MSAGVTLSSRGTGAVTAARAENAGNTVGMAFSVTWAHFSSAMTDRRHQGTNKGSLRSA